MAKKDYLFDSILENSINTSVKANLSAAISSAGVNVSKDAGIWEYPEIIRKNLISKTVTGLNILGKDIINIDIAHNIDTNGKDICEYTLSTIFDTNGVPRPNYAEVSRHWGKNFTVEEVFDDLFKNILPCVRGVHAGDITKTDIDGNDTTEWNNTLFNRHGIKTGLEPTSKYIRLYLTCQAEPLFVNIGNMVKDATNGYNVVSSDTIKMEVDDTNSSISAHINIINDAQLMNLGIISKI